MLVLGIETSCDETAAAVVEDAREIRSNVVASQVDLHRKYGGVVPEIACRAHIESILPCVEEALRTASTEWSDLDGIAVTHAPGLVGALLIGLTAAKSLAWAHGLPLIAVDHLHAHAMATFLTPTPPELPTVALVVSGGHTVLAYYPDPLHREILGATTDDAAGEAFDKVAALLHLGYPGGPIIDELAQGGRPDAISFPRTRLGDSLDFSFSGLKTAVLYHCCGQNGAEPLPEYSSQELADIAASFQEAVVDMLVERTLLACDSAGVGTVTVGGGVACNSRLRSRLASAADENGLRLHIPPPELCLDNGAMIAALGHFYLEAGLTSPWEVDAEPQPIRARPAVGE